MGSHLDIFKGQNEINLIGTRHLITGKCGVIPFTQQSTVVTSNGLKWNVGKHFLKIINLI